MQGETAKSALFVPLIVGGAATGRISLQNLDREYAFSEADVRLLVTLAGSLSVALENARLFEETRQRAAELAVINSVGQAFADQLDLEALIDRLGDQLREVFSADIVYIALHDQATDLIEFAYYSEGGVAEPRSGVAPVRARASSSTDRRAARAAPAQPRRGVRELGRRGDRHAGELLPRRADPRRRAARSA